MSHLPRRLPRDFTAQTLRLALAARPRYQPKSQGIFRMKSLFTIKRFAPIAIIGLASIGSLGAYAVTQNWFGGDVSANRVNDVFTVDTTGCTAHLPGIEQDQQQHAQFKIVKDTGLSAEELKNRVLQMCEFYAANDFYQTKTEFGPLLTQPQPNTDYWLYRSKIKAIDHNQVTLSIFGMAGAHAGTFSDVTLPIDTAATVYNQGAPASLRELAVGDSVVFVTKTPGSPQDIHSPGKDPITSETRIVSLFKTQYDMLDGVEHEKAFYEDNGIMPIAQ